MKKLSTDVIIIGKGLAGLQATIHASKYTKNIILLAKTPKISNYTTYPTVGDVTYSTAESAEELFRQLVKAGGYLNDQRLIEVLVKRFPQEIEEMKKYGLKTKVSHPTSPKRPSLQRICGEGIKPGEALLDNLSKRIRDINIMDNFFVVSLLVKDSRVVGVSGFDVAEREFYNIFSKSVVLATGGGAKIYKRSDVPKDATGDGYILAYEAGAKLINLECIISYLPLENFKKIFSLEKIPDEEILATGHAHYFLGGVKIDENAMAMNGLFAAGEVTGGVFGAGRLAGSALADCIVFGAIAGENAGKLSSEVETVETNNLEKLFNPDGKFQPSEISEELKSIMWRYCCILKNQETISFCLNEIKKLNEKSEEMRVSSFYELKDAMETKNMLKLAELICLSSLKRCETRGCFWRVDYPEPDNTNWLKNLIIHKSKEGPKIETAEINKTRDIEIKKPIVYFGCFGYSFE